MQTTSPASRSKLSASSGLISEVSALIAQWFPTHDLEAVATAAADESPDGWLHFDLFVTIRTVTYRKKQRYSSFCEGEIGRDLGQIETAHEAREKLGAVIATTEGTDFEIHSQGETAEALLEAVPMFGWEVFSTTMISRQCFPQLFNSASYKWAILSVDDRGLCKDALVAAEKVYQLRGLRVGEVVARII